MQTLTQTITTKDKDNIKINVVVACLGNGKFDYKVPILGKKMCEWVGDAFENYNITYADQLDNNYSLARKYCTGFDYTIVIGGNMPLITRQDVLELVQYAIFKGANLVKFVGGYVVNNKYLNSTENPQIDNIFTGDMQHFYLVENKKQLNQVTKILTQQIIEYHQLQGVDIVGKVIIEPNVEIESGVCIMSGNIIKGYSYISKGAILKENNVIQDSFIGADSCISYSVVTKSRIGANCIIMPFCNIENANIADNTTIQSNTNI